MTTDDQPKYATGGPIDPGRAYRFGEDGPPPLILPIGWEQYESGSRMAERIKAAWADQPQRTQWLTSKGYELWIADDKGAWVQAWPPSKPAKRAWWEYRWPPFALALSGLICSIIAIVMALGNQP